MGPNPTLWNFISDFISFGGFVWLGPGNWLRTYTVGAGCMRLSANKNPPTDNLHFIALKVFDAFILLECDETDLSNLYLYKYSGANFSTALTCQLRIQAPIYQHSKY